MPQQTSPLASAKQECRHLAHQKRVEAAAQDAAAPEGRMASDQAAQHFLENFTEIAGKVIAGYAAIRTELKVWGLMAALESQGARLCLPVVWQKDCWLKFSAWRTDEALNPGAFGAVVPDESAEELIPDIILLPLLGFAANGIRLGYGGGYYDRTIDRLCREQGRDIALLGMAYQMQQFDVLPYDENDRPLHAVVTEQGITRFG